ncbi:putative ring-cleaving dioxygenase MhqO [Hartmannibacter diazotrophicus]|uniref:Putative ring-cleaving dioxygenase MhqO n=1 Tax=Hartmannibacter diazotrophicus TaxID=1482074 RepID=A0A2C9D192_9HYPH|nr:VOC family protein [Hartmannibacter diazotrophicus]SON54004.1 putative ring-cleaving dioxygenase MhqO [Hartmannibacter diazotrophicus]
MLTQIKGLHHVTSMAAKAQQNSDFFTKVLGLRRVKKTVNFDAPDVYHLYYGDEIGTPGTVMTYFPFPHIAAGRPGTGEVGETYFAIPKGSQDFWKQRLEAQGVAGLRESEIAGEKHLHFDGPDHDAFSLVEVDGDARTGWDHAGVSEAEAIRGFHGASLRVSDPGATKELLGFMGYQEADKKDNWSRFVIPGGNGADFVDVETVRANVARLGAGSVHHIAFAVEDRAAQLEVRKALLDTGYQVTPVIDRDYFWAIYFRTPGGVLFEIATNEPGFSRDEDTAHLGEALKLPTRYEPHRSHIEGLLEPITD